MYYFEFRGEQVLKYEVVVDTEKLKKLKDEIIYNCGHIKHVEDNTDSPELLRPKYYKNYREKVVGEKEYFEETRDIYHIAYDKILESELALKIESFLKGDLELLFYLDSIENKETVLEAINLEIENIKESIVEKTTCGEVDTEGLGRLIKRLEELKNEINLNKDRKKEFDYVNEVKKLITINLIGTMSLEDYNNARKFLGTSGNIQVLKRSISRN